MSAIALLLMLAACSRSPPPARETLWLFGSRAELELRGVDEADARPALAEIAQRLNLRHREWHAWEDSDLTDINRALSEGRETSAPESILAALTRIAPLVEDSDGRVDPAIGGLVRLWGFHRSEFPILDPPPDDDAIAAWLSRRPRLTDLRIRDGRLSTDNPALALDLAAFAEGLAIEETVAVLDRHGIDNALIAIGGDIFALGDGDGRPWRVALRDPHGERPDSVLGWVELGDREALFSSGGYQRYRLDPEGRRWPHILDPDTGRPAGASAATAVLHPDPVRADAAATALFVAGPEGFAELTERLRLGCALLIDRDQRLHFTKAMAHRLRLVRAPERPVTTLWRGDDCLGGGDSIP